MAIRHRLTSCAASSHPDGAAAVGEVVGHVQETLAGSPQFTLVLLDRSRRTELATVAAAVHRLLGPDLLLATTASAVAGADTLAATRGTVVAWALCGVEVEPGPTGNDKAVDPAPTIQFSRRSNGSTVVTLGHGPDDPAPLLFDGAGTVARPTPSGFMLPPGSARVHSASGRRRLGLPMLVTGVDGRRLRTLDGRKAALELVDRLDQDHDDPQETVGRPPLALEVSSGPPIAVHNAPPGHDDGPIQLERPVAEGETVQLVTYDRHQASWDLMNRISGGTQSPGRAALLGHPLDPGSVIDHHPVATATAHWGRETEEPGPDLTPWTTLTALTVEVVDDP